MKELTFRSRKILSTKGINKTVGMVTGLARKLTKATPVLLPAGTIIANVADIASSSPDLASGIGEFVKRYSGVDMAAGGFDGAAFMKGGGSLIITGIIGKLVKDLV